MTAELFRDSHSKALLLFKRGHKMLHCLVIAPPVRVVKFERAEERYFTPLLLAHEPYPLRRALRHFRKAGRIFGITKKARIIINALKENRSES